MSDRNMTAKKTEPTKTARTVEAVVVSSKMNKTRVVQVKRQEKHPLYGKYLTKLTKMYVHDEENSSRDGDVVLIEHTRPLSKTKRWNLKQILKREEQE